MSLVPSVEIQLEYLRAGLTVDQIASRLHDVETSESATSVSQHADALYVNSSDPIDVLLRHALVKGKRVLTVAGSGDFALIFLHGHCEALRIVDLSPYALFLSELKLRAVEALTYVEYCDLFLVPQIYENDYHGPFVSRAPYWRLREQLSNHARAFFDFITDERNANSWQILKPCSGNSNILRFRTFYHPSGNVGLRHVLRDPHTYSSIQKSLRSTPCVLTLEDVSAVDANFDYVYISNIGYLHCRQGELIRKILDRGSATVGISSRSLQSISWVIDEDGHLYPSFDAAPPGIPVANVFLNIVAEPERGGEHCKRIEPLIPRARVSIGGVPAEVIAVGIGPDFPVYLEARSTI
jgi:hypothetical protein